MGRTASLDVVEKETCLSLSGFEPGTVPFEKVVKNEIIPSTLFSRFVKNLMLSGYCTFWKVSCQETFGFVSEN